MNSWDIFTTKLLKIRRSSIKDKYALNLLSVLDLAELNGSMYNNLFFTKLQLVFSSSAQISNFIFFKHFLSEVIKYKYYCRGLLLYKIYTNISIL